MYKRQPIFHADEVTIPKVLNVSKLCEKTWKKSTTYHLVGSILHDEGDYVAIVRDLTNGDQEDEEACKLMESEEVIPMAESDVFDFIQGEGEGSPCGTVFAYKLEDVAQHKEQNQILSDIIIAHVSGKLDSKDSDYYYEEEIIEDEEEYYENGS